MNINRQYQGLHGDTGVTGVDWVLKQQIERDICLLYHQLADYSFIMGDLYYGSVFALPYWEFLDLPEFDSAEERFIRDGCLVMILAMAWEQIDGAGAYIGPHLSACKTAVERLQPDEEKTQSLVRTVLLALDTAKTGQVETEELTALSQWVHREYVQGYFRRLVQEFDQSL